MSNNNFHDSKFPNSKPADPSAHNQNSGPSIPPASGFPFGVPMDLTDSGPFRPMKLEIPPIFTPQHSFPNPFTPSSNFMVPNLLQYQNLYPFYQNLYNNRIASLYANFNFLKFCNFTRQPQANDLYRLPPEPTITLSEPPSTSFDLKPTIPDVLTPNSRIRKVKRGISPSKKDDRYYDRRRKNNRAAKRSREKQRLSNNRCRLSLIYYHSEVRELVTSIKKIFMNHSIDPSEMGAAARFLEQPVTAETAFESSQKVALHPTFPFPMTNVHVLVDDNGTPIKRYLANEYHKYFGVVPPDLTNYENGVDLNDFNLYDRLHPNLEGLQNLELFQHETEPEEFSPNAARTQNSPNP